MKKSEYIAKWWHKQEIVELTRNLIAMKKAEVINLAREIDGLEKKLILLEKETFSVRLEAIGETDPVEGYIKGE